MLWAHAVRRQISPKRPEDRLIGFARCQRLSQHKYKTLPERVPLERFQQLRCPDAVRLWGRAGQFRLQFDKFGLRRIQQYRIVDLLLRCS